ncbi:hypothetical protein BCh11DRAFT_01743 [Burkholderia sp. Ch1-1]|nr:hypothetical protein BCh11DRAFT_01743 [Burkholderia sp. Ch1-1]
MFGQIIHPGKAAAYSKPLFKPLGTQMLPVSAVLISLAPMWAILLAVSGASAYMLFWRKAIK